MEFDFTTILDRHGRDSLAADKIPFEGVSVEEGEEILLLLTKFLLKVFRWKRGFPRSPCGLPI